jgi:hypothetical protein
MKRIIYSFESWMSIDNLLTILSYNDYYEDKLKGPLDFDTKFGYIFYSIGGFIVSIVEVLSFVLLWLLKILLDSV